MNKSMELSPSHLLHKLALDMDRAADKLLQKHLSISYARFHFLLVLSGSGEMSQHAMALALGYSDPAVSNMINEISKDNLVQVKVDPLHRRRRLVTITGKGEAIVAKSMELLDQCFSDVAREAEVDETEYAALTERLITALSKKQ